MTEAEWLSCDEPQRLVEYVESRASVRKKRLLLSACCRRVERFLRHPTIHEFIDASDRFADGEISLDALKRFYWACESTDPFSSPGGHNAPFLEAENAVRGLGHNFDLGHMICAVNATAEEAGVSATLAFDAMQPAEIVSRLRAEHAARYDSAGRPESRAQAMLIREMFGNPFSPVGASPEWRTETTLALARHMYETRDFSAMPILADALQDAGCDSGAVLTHCRDVNQVHVRGCWVIDSLLGKA